MSKVAAHQALRWKGKKAANWGDAIRAGAKALDRAGHSLDWWRRQIVICRKCALGAQIDQHEGRWYLTGPMTEVARCRGRETP